MTSSRKTIANQRNAAKSTGPKTERGKMNSSSNALKHGFYSRELTVLEEDKQEFEVLREELRIQFAPNTAMQCVAFEQILASCWRCKLAMRLEMNRLASRFTAARESVSDESDRQRDVRALQWYGASHDDRRHALRVLQDLCADVSQNGALHLEDRRELLERVFGSEFYDILAQWKPMSVDAILLAEKLEQEAKTFKNVQIPEALTAPQGVQYLKDPKEKWQMLVKLVEMQIQHLRDIGSVSAHSAQVRESAPTDFVPRYFASASRDLQRAVDWYLYLRSKAL